jgi:hypothetical protein
MAAEVEERAGFLCIKAGNKATKAVGKKEVYCLTAGSTLHCYKTPLETEPLSSIELKGCTAEKAATDPKKKKKTVINLKIGDSLYNVEASGDDDCASWMEEFKRVASLDAQGPPSKEAINHKKMSKSARIAKAAGGKMVGTGAAKAMTRKLADEETLTLLRNLKVVIKKDSNMKKAEEIENDIMKIGMKSFFLVDNKIVDSDAFLEVDGPIRKAFELLVKVWDKKDRTSPDSLKVAFTSIEGHLRKAEQTLTAILLPHLQPKSINRVKNIFSYVGSARFLQNIMMDDELEDEVHELVKAIEYYTQFHHYKEDKPKK